MAFNFKTKFFKKKYRKENDYVNTSITKNDSYTDVHLGEKSAHNYEVINVVGQDTNHTKTKQQIYTTSVDRQDAHKTNHTYENNKQLINRLHQKEIDGRESKQTGGPSAKKSSSKIVKIGIGILAVSWVGIASALVAVVIVMSQSTRSPCEGTGCLNNGTCIVSEENIVCKCIDGFSGKRCEITPCDKKTCEHGGTCYLKDSRSECACPNGFDGDNCTITPCTSSPCLNKRQCEYSVNAPYYKCKCSGGFSGDECKDTPCTINPCLNNGQCEYFIKDPYYKCNCLDGFSGVNCTVSPCDDKTCLNYGHCDYSINAPYHLCKCLNGSSGYMCEVTQCNTSNPCLNDGQCEYSLNYPYYECNCQTGSSGAECEVTPCSSSPCKNDSECIVNGSGYTCTCIKECTGDDYTDYKCDAENYLNQTCFLDQDVWSDDTDWIRWRDNTPSPFTGPSRAAEGSFYFYVESSGIPTSSKARFVSRPLKTGKITFEALTGNGSESDIAIDNITITSDLC
ncbi:unnamed protein product [Mytilus coruscus]|uniref:Uncharacterized protein n=1 Tax=Mytilus coruscus TaxID=42192 RepID=A0A6J8B9L0_MYTCO|nr:unnamed protein product [Mytilus coruscus]